MDLDQYRRNVARLAHDAWPEDITQQPKIMNDQLFARLLEETGELAQVTRKSYGRRIGREEEEHISKASVMDEIGDVLFLLARIADLHDVQLSQAAQRSLDKLEHRINFEQEAKKRERREAISMAVTTPVRSTVRVDLPRRSIGSLPTPKR
jgi:NTP pyrophosphatase (non-canonical NTP hydrolase)